MIDYFDISGYIEIMTVTDVDILDSETAATAFAALGSPQRLQVLRMLVRAGPEGMRVGDLAAKTDLAASTLSHHLKALTNAGLVKQDRRGREIICVGAAFTEVDALSKFLLNECCADAPKDAHGAPETKTPETGVV